MKAKFVLFLLNRVVAYVQAHPEAIDDALTLLARRLHEAVAQARYSA